ncbi:unnamed protein product [Thlaspi arvense]|uniref:Uncharacterized protein n=1 Tax=Thlaspi arvense TaxID=13288 RepID=A0AAU9T3Z4_THLAR|nr:unnamed protein product [Thlaspi arvense]
MVKYGRNSAVGKLLHWHTQRSKESLLLLHTCRIQVLRRTKSICFQKSPTTMMIDDGQDSDDQEQLFSSIWNITAPNSDWSYTMDLMENPRENDNSKNIAEESS